MRYPEALEILRGLQGTGLRPGLERVLALAAGAGHPERDLRFIHVAGTNGKGSTCAFLESLYRRAGLRVGLYTSPHLRTFRERIQVDRTPLPRDAAADAIERLSRLAQAQPVELRPSLFEFLTVLALEWFRFSECDLVVWETGMGGRLDATNFVSPLATAITNVGWDHAAWLGNSLPAIAREKAGIAKPGVPLVSAAEGHEVREVIREVARAAGAPLRWVEPEGAEARAARNPRLGLVGEHQVRNAALALAIAETLHPVFPHDVNRAEKALESVQWPARFEVVSRGEHCWVLDVAHNEPAIRALAQTMRERFPGQRAAVIFGMFPDKDPQAAIDTLLRNARRIVVAPVGRGWGTESAVLVERLRANGLVVEVAADARAAAVRVAEEPLVLVTGSFQIVGAVSEALEGIPETASELGLNEWRKAEPPSAHLIASGHRE